MIPIEERGSLVTGGDDSNSVAGKYLEIRGGRLQRDRLLPAQVMTQHQFAFVIGKDDIRRTLALLTQKVAGFVDAGAALVAAPHVRLTLLPNRNAQHKDKTRKSNRTKPALTR